MYATRDRACSGYLVEAGEARILMDCGSGTWRNLLQQMDHTSLTGVLLSHRHPDHVSDVFQLFHARRYGQTEPLPEIPLWAPPETLERVCGFAAELDQAFSLRPVSAGDTIELDGVRMAFFSMAHPPQTVGIRIEDADGVLAYSSDTGPGGDLEALARDADVFICEATLQDDDLGWEGHMTAGQAGSAAAGAGAKKLLLTHLPPERDAGLSLAEAHKTSGQAEVQLAADGLRLELT